MRLVDWMTIHVIGWGGLNLPSPRAPRGWRPTLVFGWLWNGERFVDTDVAANERPVAR